MANMHTKGIRKIVRNALKWCLTERKNRCEKTQLYFAVDKTATTASNIYNSILFTRIEMNSFGAVCVFFLLTLIHFQRLNSWYELCEINWNWSVIVWIKMTTKFKYFHYGNIRARSRVTTQKKGNIIKKNSIISRFDQIGRNLFSLSLSFFAALFVSIVIVPFCTIFLWITMFSNGSDYEVIWQHLNQIYIFTTLDFLSLLLHSISNNSCIFGAKKLCLSKWLT